MNKITAWQMPDLFASNSNNNLDHNDKAKGQDDLNRAFLSDVDHDDAVGVQDDPNRPVLSWLYSNYEVGVQDDPNRSVLSVENVSTKQVHFHLTEAQETSANKKDLLLSVTKKYPGFVGKLTSDIRAQNKLAFLDMERSYEKQPTSDDGRVIVSNHTAMDLYKELVTIQQESSLNLGRLTKKLKPSAKDMAELVEAKEKQINFVQEKFAEEAKKILSKFTIEEKKQLLHAVQDQIIQQCPIPDEDSIYDQQLAGGNARPFAALLSARSLSRWNIKNFSTIEDFLIHQIDKPMKDVALEDQHTKLLGSEY